MSIDLRRLISRISIGALYPSMKIAMNDEIPVVVRGPGGSIVPQMQPAVVITMDVVDAATQEYVTVLAQTYPVPEDGFETEEEAVRWIYRGVEAVLVHELQEFFRVDDEVRYPPKHPIRLDP